MTADSSLWNAVAQLLITGTTSANGDGTDVWIGSLNRTDRTLTGILCTFDTLKRDLEIKLLYLATIMPDGSPQVTPIWFSTDGEHILINTNEGRTKDKNMKARPQVAMAIQDPDNQDRYLGMRGEVVGSTREGADEHINRLSLKYYSKPWTHKEGQRRIIFRIRPIHFGPHNG